MIKADSPPPLPVFYSSREIIQGTLSPLLSERECQVFGFAASGLSSREIADQLGIARRTVEKHRDRIRKKLEGTGAVKLMRSEIGFGSAVWFRHWLFCVVETLNAIDDGRLTGLISEIEGVNDNLRSFLSAPERAVKAHARESGY